MARKAKRRNPVHRKHRAKVAHRKPRAKITHRRTISSEGRHRPVLIFSKTAGWSRPKKSHIAHPIKVNGRKRKHRKNPVTAIKNMFNASNLKKLASLGAGFVVGQQLSVFLAGNGFFGFGSKPAFLTKLESVRMGHGVIHIVLGGLIAAKSKNELVKNAALGVASFGAYDIVAQVINHYRPDTIPALAGNSGRLAADYRPNLGMDSKDVLRGNFNRRASSSALGMDYAPALMGDDYNLSEYMS